jgi:hypothetical protein
MEIKENWINHLNLKINEIFIIDCIYYNKNKLLNLALKLDSYVRDSLDVLLNKKIILKTEHFYEVSEIYVKTMYEAPVIKEKEKTPTINIKELNDKYRELFPKGINNNGFPYKGDKQGCLKKLKKFTSTYPEYTESIILQSTERYINEKRKENFSYMKLAHYFIEKNGVSDLASFCEQTKEGNLPVNYNNILNL